MTADQPSVTDGRSILRGVRARLRERAAAATDPQLTVGPRVVLVELSHPRHGLLAGVAHRPSGAFRASDASVADLAALAESPDEAATGADSGGETRLRRAVGIGTLNALSVPDVDWRPGDPMAALSDDVDAVATVGLFGPAFKKFGAVDVRVVERDPERAEAALSAHSRPAVAPDISTSVYAPDECDRAFDGVDVCFITGSTLIYGGIDRYVAAATEADVPLVVLVGATASFLPEPAFDAGIDLVAGAHVTNVDSVRTRVVAGDCGTDLHEAGLEKVYVAASDDLPHLRERAMRTKPCKSKDNT
ncbi:MAG: Rossmann-like domain-containing protein [Halobacteriota archaeon]